MKNSFLRAAGLLLALVATSASSAPRTDAQDAPSASVQMVSPVRGSAAKAAPALWPTAAPVRFNGDELFALSPGAEVALTLPNADVQAYVLERVIDHLAHCPALHVVGFQTERGLAAHFAHFLQRQAGRLRLENEAQVLPVRRRIEPVAGRAPCRRG